MCLARKMCDNKAPTNAKKKEEKQGNFKMRLTMAGVRVDNLSKAE